MCKGLTILVQLNSEPASLLTCVLDGKGLLHRMSVRVINLHSVKDLVAFQIISIHSSIYPSTDHDPLVCSALCPCPPSTSQNESVDIYSIEARDSNWPGMT